MANGVSKLRWLPGAATAVAITSCYGTALLIGLLSLLGVSLAIDNRVLAGAISLFAALAAILIAISSWPRRASGPTVVAGIGLAFILWSMYGSYGRAIEIAGFVLLITAAVWDWRARPRQVNAKDDVSWIETRELAARLQQSPKPILIDVRGTDEFDGDLGHLRDARNIALADLPQRLEELKQFNRRDVILVCRTQMRSAKAAAVLKEAGFRTVVVLRGGMVEWNRCGFPVARETVR
jgi:rhodanese-related sulfurtransferase